MKICLLNPPKLLTVKSMMLPIGPPLGLAYIAGALKRAGHQIQIIDALASAPDKVTEFDKDVILHGLHDLEILERMDPDTEVIGLGIMFSNNWIANRRLIHTLRRYLPNAKIVIGGEHASSVPDICLKQCPEIDAVVLGEGEETMVELVDAFAAGTGLQNIKGIVFRNESGEIIRTGPRTRIRELEDIAWPAWDLFPLEDYMVNKLSYGVYRGRSLPVMATRGCPYSCTFCSSPQMWGTRYMMRSPADMADEIEFLYNTYQVRNFDFYDLTAVIQKGWIVDFCKELISRKLDITWQIPAGTRSEAIDREVARWLYQSGCRNITYAPESGSPEVLKAVKKKVKLDKMLESINASYKENLNIKLNMMLGFPDEKSKDAWQTTFFLIKAGWAGAHDAVPSIFSPYPGSVLFERLRAEGKLDPEKDEYWRSIIFATVFSKGPLYANHMSRPVIYMHYTIQLSLFFLFNYLFRPIRVFRTIRNLVTKKYESRGEVSLGELVRQNTQWVIRKENEMVAAYKRFQSLGEKVI